jgi:hypothetical protein
MCCFFIKIYVYKIESILIKLTPLCAACSESCLLYKLNLLVCGLAMFNDQLPSAICVFAISLQEEYVSWHTYFHNCNRIGCCNGWVFESLLSAINKWHDVTMMLTTQFQCLFAPARLSIETVWKLVANAAVCLNCSQCLILGWWFCGYVIDLVENYW